MSRHLAAPAPHAILRGAIDTTPLTLVGHPFAPIGMGEQLRSHLAACRSVSLDAGVFDVFRCAGRSDPGYLTQLADAECSALPGGIRVFHINGDEVEPVLAALEARGAKFRDGYNIIVPAWELPSYPAKWARWLKRFDEVWALSRFLQDSLAAAGVASHLVGQSVQAPRGAMLPRRYFGLSESAFVIMTMFDLSSYARRKNPDAVLALFNRLRRAQPLLDVQLVLKVKNGERDAADWAAALPDDGRIRIIDTPLDSRGVVSLVNACDLFVSLHRAEGFGRGLGEAMMLGRLAMGTAWSGNLDFMTEANSLLVQHQLVPVQRNEYPHAHGQSWAEPDLDHAAALLASTLSDPGRARAKAARGQAEIALSHGHRAIGLRILGRLEQIAADQALSERLTEPA